jgi:hypothetical protein
MITLSLTHDEAVIVLADLESRLDDLAGHGEADPIIESLYIALKKKMETHHANP